MLSGAVNAQAPATTQAKLGEQTKRKVERVSNAPLTPEQIKEKQAERSLKVAKKLELTEEQTKKFIPVFENYQKQKMELYKANREAHKEFSSKENKSEADHKKMVDLLTDTKVKEAQLQQEYSKNLSAFLPAEKVYKAVKISSNPFIGAQKSQDKNGQHGVQNGKTKNKEYTKGKGQRQQKGGNFQKSDVMSKMNKAQKNIDKTKK